ncbi:MAG: hypothetical protein ABR530_01845 [Pyrinomonadaceae bacterium]
MFRQSFISILFLLSITFIASAVQAQVAPVSGTVEMQAADGTRKPAAGALIEVYRTDIKGGFPSAKTNGKGQFSFAGMPLGGLFTFAVSAPGAAPTIVPNIKAGQEKLLITLTPGDGSKYSEEQARKGAVISTTGASEAELAAQKKQQAEYEAKKKEIEAKNAHAEKTNEIVNRVLKEGNEAYGAKNYDVAIAKYDEGIAADPQFLGSAPVFYNNRGAALVARAVESYNGAIKAADATEKIAGFGKAKKDFSNAVAGYLLSWTLLKNAQASDIPDKASYDAAKAGTLKGAVESFKMSVRTEQVDPEVIEAAKVLIPEYIAAEADAAKKAEASLTFADLYRVAGDSENAITAYKKILETSPDDKDALAGAGLSLVNLGFLNNDKTKLQEGANLLQKFASVAPDTHKYKADAVALIDTLKKEQNVTPQKVTTPKKRP